MLGRTLDPGLSDFRCALFDQCALPVGQAVERVVVKDEDLSVGARPDVAFDGIARVDRG